MIALIDLYRKELLKVNGFSPSTVETYSLSIQAFCRFAKNELQTDPPNVSGPQLLKWILYLKNTGIGHSRIENHHYALKSFFAFMKKAGHIPSNPAQALPLLITRRRQVTKPISTRHAFKLLDSFDQSTWHGLRNYTILAVLWTLGLRTSELTGLKVKSFETGHGRQIGLLRIRGKNKKQRALFVVDRLFDALIHYLNHPLSPNKKLAPLFPGQPNTAISNSRVQRIVKDQAKKVGIIAAVTPRVLRHSFATEMYHQNVPLSAIQAMMGHDSIADTSIFLKLHNPSATDSLPFYDVLKIRSGYRNRPGALTPQQIKRVLKQIDTHTILGIRDYALMYQLGLRIGEVHGLNLENIDLNKNKITVRRTNITIPKIIQT